MKKIFLIIASIFLLLVSCDTVELEETDPNNFEDATPDLMIKTPFLAMDMLIEGELARLTGMWAGHFTGSDRQYISYNKYIVTAGEFDNIWVAVYADGIAQCRLTREKAIAINNHEIRAISFIVEANILGQAAALWGSVPDSEAANFEQFPEPKYDNQADVYNHVIEMLKEAIALFSEHDISPSANSYAKELIESESLDWIEVAHSLMARYYLHIGNYDEAAAHAKKGISSSAKDLMIAHPSGSYPNNIEAAQNLYFDFCAWNRDGYMGAGDAYLVDVLLDRSDARLEWYYFRPGYWNDDWYPNCWNGGDDGWYSVDGIFDADQPFPVITYYETQLILAECELVGSNKNAFNALEALNNTRTYWDSKMDELFGSDDYYETFDADDFSNDSELLKEILMEKYISCFGELEAFNDLRRTNNYIGVPLKAGAGNEMPQRILIPQSEINSNDNAQPAAKGIFVTTPVNESSYPGI